MIFQKLWHSLLAQVNKVANMFWEKDPVAQMKLEYDRAVDQLKGGRQGLEQYRGLVEKVHRKVADGERHIARLQTQVKSYLKAGERETASRFAVELQRARADLEQHKEQRDQHEASYEANLRQIKAANRKLGELREKIARYDSELKMSAAEAEIAAIAQGFDMNVTTDFGQIEQVIQDKIDANRGKSRVASDLSTQALSELEAEERLENEMAERALAEFEAELGMRSADTTTVKETAKDLGPAEHATEEA